MATPTNTIPTPEPVVNIIMPLRAARQLIMTLTTAERTIFINRCNIARRQKKYKDLDLPAYGDASDAQKAFYKSIYDAQYTAGSLMSLNYMRMEWRDPSAPIPDGVLDAVAHPPVDSGLSNY
jgi:hypothetical protein